MKTMSQNKIWFMNGMVVGALLFLAGLWGFLSMMEWATAATYNVYFNNVEQGANSTASPTLHISDSKPVGVQPTSVSETVLPSAATPPVEQPPRVPAAAAPIPEGPKPEPKASENSLPVGGSTAARVEAMSSPSSSHWFHLAFLGTSALSGDELKDSQGGKKLGAMLMASAYPLRDFGINAFTGIAPAGKAYYGGELEFDPLHVSLFGLDRLVDAGFVVGASSMGQREGFDLVHAGLRTALNFGPNYSIVGGLRTHVNKGDGDRDWLADAGISIRF